MTWKSYLITVTHAGQTTWTDAGCRLSVCVLAVWCTDILQYCTDDFRDMACVDCQLFNLQQTFRELNVCLNVVVSRLSNWWLLKALPWSMTCIRYALNSRIWPYHSSSISQCFSVSSDNVLSLLITDAHRSDECIKTSIVCKCNHSNWHYKNFRLTAMFKKTRTIDCRRCQTSTGK
jgi:hypothetical protein